jgi:hypothetical protein
LQGHELVPEVEEANLRRGLGRLVGTVKGLKDNGTECQYPGENNGFGFHDFSLVVGFIEQC